MMTETVPWWPFLLLWSPLPLAAVLFWRDGALDLAAIYAAGAIGVPIVLFLAVSAPAWGQIPTGKDYGTILGYDAGTTGCPNVLSQPPRWQQPYCPNSSPGTGCVGQAPPTAAAPLRCNNTIIGGPVGQTAQPATTPDELKASVPQLEEDIRAPLHEFLGTRNPCPEMPQSPDEKNYCLVAIGLGALQNATSMHNTIAIGRCAGASLTTESDDILVGDYVTAPRGRSGFINIANALCFWRDTGERAACPAPEPECAKP
jgi:hypothetical protein